MADRSSRVADRGAVLVLAAMLLTGLMAMAAIVVDIGHMRGMRRSNQSAVDLAALAAGDALAALAGPDGPAACQDAVRYLRLNVEEFVGLTMNCAALPAICLPNTSPVTVTATTANYDVAITYPVSDASIADPTTGGGGLRVDDGTPCDRVRVEVEQRSPTFFAGVLGVKELSTRASAVVRQIPESERRIPSLWLLDPYGCNVLSVQGGSQVTAGTPAFGGLISLDSDGSACSGNSFTIDVGGAGTRLHAVFPTSDPPARISLYAMTPGQMTCLDGNLRACDPSDVANGTLSPQPVRRTQRATRGPIDHRFNCRVDDGSYPEGEDPYPEYHGLTIEPCDGASGDYIDQLIAGVGASGAPIGFSTWPHGCSGFGSLSVAGNWFVDCNDFRLGNTDDVTFTGGNVIFRGDITMTGGILRFNANNPTPTLVPECLAAITNCLAESSAEAAWVYMRDGGDLSMTGGTLLANRTTIYQHSGYFRMAGGSPPVWSAPTEGPFTSLSVWSELSSNRFQINGGASMELTGIFFTPEANPFTLNGGAPLLPQRAQFISYRAAISGGAVLNLAPLEIQPIIIPPPEPLLIR